MKWKTEDRRSGVKHPAQAIAYRLRNKQTPEQYAINPRQNSVLITKQQNIYDGTPEVLITAVKAEAMSVELGAAVMRAIREENRPLVVTKSKTWAEHHRKNKIVQSGVKQIHMMLHNLGFNVKGPPPTVDANNPNFQTLYRWDTDEGSFTWDVRKVMQ